MRVLMSSDQAKLIAGLHKAATSDAARPVMQMIRPSFEDGRLTLYVTDSYRAVRRTFPVTESEGDPASMKLLHAKELGDGIKAAAKVAGMLWIDFEQGSVKTHLSPDDLNAFVYPVRTEEFDKFPKGIVDFFDAKHWDTERLDRATFWLNPALLRDTLDASGLTKSQQSNVQLRVFHAGTEKSNSRDGSPVGFEIVDNRNRDVTFHAIQMPVRFNG